MSQRITIDPVTRIEGHLRIDVEVDGGKVTQAWSSGTMWRGVGNILLTDEGVGCGSLKLCRRATRSPMR